MVQGVHILSEIYVSDDFDATLHHSIPTDMVRSAQSHQEVGSHDGTSATVDRGLQLASLDSILAVEGNDGCRPHTMPIFSNRKTGCKGVCAPWAMG
jgi:hypothetical protein